MEPFRRGPVVPPGVVFRDYAGSSKDAVAIPLLFGHKCPIFVNVRGRDFVKRVFELGTERGVFVRIDSKRGKGSHVTLYYGSRKTVVKDRRKELTPGLLSAMIRQLNLDPGDFR